jgi:hypothetical protein
MALIFAANLLEPHGCRGLYCMLFACAVLAILRGTKRAHQQLL